MNRGSPAWLTATSRILAGFNEAPIHESGKWPSGRDPRCEIPVASMRPRFMNRGSTMPASRLRWAAARFNEAPIHESGKYRHQEANPSRFPGFNEAPIHESGKFSQRVVDGLISL